MDCTPASQMQEGAQILDFMTVSSAAAEMQTVYLLTWCGTN